MRKPGVSVGIFLIAALTIGSAATASDDVIERAVEARTRGDYETAIVLLESALPDAEVDLLLAETLAWAKRFEEAEAKYESILAGTPRSPRARMGLARVVLWQGRYREATARFGEILRGDPENVDALEGRANAAYWSGDYRAAARDFRFALAGDPTREAARRSLSAIAALAMPSQRMTIDVGHDDQPLDAARMELEASFFSDPLTRWTVLSGAYHLDAERLGKNGGRYVVLENETKWQSFIFGGSIGVFEFPDGTRRPIGGASVRYRTLTLDIQRREELATATSVAKHAASTTSSLRWSRSGDRWIAAAEASHRRYFDGNSGQSLAGWVMAPVLRRGNWTLWSGISGMARDTAESRFRMTAISSTLDETGTFFHYQYRGKHDPYWAPENLREGRVVVVLERRSGRGGVKFRTDGGIARDRGRAFGPDAGAGPFPTSVFSFEFNRRYRPYRAGITADFTPSRPWRFEIEVDHSATVDYRSTIIHAVVVRRL